MKHILTEHLPCKNIARSVFKFGFPLEIDGTRYKDKYDNFDE